MLQSAERPLIVAGGGIINADACELLVEFAEITGIPVIPTLMGWGAIPDDHPLMAGMVGLQTSHRYGNATLLASDFVFGIGNRWANRHTGGDRHLHQGPHASCISTSSRRRSAACSCPISASSRTPARRSKASSPSRGSARRTAPCSDYSAWRDECRERKRTMLRRTHFEETPIKPQRVYEEMNKAFGKDARYVSTIGLSQIAAAQFLHVYHPRHWINCGQAGPLGWTIPAALGARVAAPEAEIVAISGDYDFQFLIEELAVGAQFNLPYVHVVVNNSYLGLIRQSQRGFQMDYCVQLAFDNINAPELGGYGVDHVKVAEGLGCKALRVVDPEEIADALREARRLAQEWRVPVVVEIILERVTNIAMGTELDNVVGVRGSRAQRRRRADRDRDARLEQGNGNAEIFSQSLDVVHRIRLSRSLRGGGQGRISRRRISRPL